MALARLQTKVKQTVTSAEKTEIDPALKEGLRQFDETAKLGNQIKDATKEALPNVGQMNKMTKTEVLGSLVKQAAAKYGTEKPEAAGLLNAGEILMALGKEERALVQEVEQHAYTTIRGVREFQESMKKETSRLKDMATDMDGANIKPKNQSGNPAFAAKAEAATQAYVAQLAKVVEMNNRLSAYRDKQRQAAKTMFELLHEYYNRSTEVIDSMIGNVG